MIDNLEQVIDHLEVEWPAKSALVVGDLMLDRYVWGDVERISPEAPVPVVRASHTTDGPGGAANVAMNLTGLGASVKLLGFAGQDSDRKKLARLLEASGITATMIQLPDTPTTTKLRIVGGAQQMLRLDTEAKTTPPAQAYSELLAVVREVLPGVDVVVLSDYAKGVLTEHVCREVISAARRAKTPVLVGPKGTSFDRYAGATTICPNLRELSEVTHHPTSPIQSLFDAAQPMVSRLGLQYLTVTMSEKGIAVLSPHSRFVAPARARPVFDVSGAGDTVLAVLALSMASNIPVNTALQLANMAAGIVVGKVGTAPIRRSELVAALSEESRLHATEKVLTLDRLLGRVAAWRSLGDRIVFTNGCFDLLHVGHISLLEEARREGDRLVVAINSDDSVRRLKGPRRPVVGEQDRARVLAALACVDAVTVFDDPTPLSLIQLVQPDVLVKGGDYTVETVVGAKEIRAWNGRVKIVPLFGDHSTTALIERLPTRHQGGPHASL